MLASPSSLLLLDEPTNHLDMRSCEVLSAALADYEGTLCIISHDRYFLDGFVNRVWEVEQGSVREYIGNYGEFENSKAQEREIELSYSTISTRKPPVSSHQQAHKRKRIEAENRNSKHQKLKPLRSNLKKIEAQLEKVLSEKTILERKLANSDIYESKNKAQLLETLNKQMALTNEENVLTKEWDKLSSQIESYNKKVF
jgi:ATP-binding cassette subfamily F protein 3